MTTIWEIEVPSETGWYWWHSPFHRENQWTPVRLFMTASMLMVETAAYGPPAVPLYDVGGEWGPRIEEPE